MKKQGAFRFIVITAAYAVLLVGLFIGRNYVRSGFLFPQTVVDFSASTPPERAPGIRKIDLNTATPEELMLLPGIGEALAQRILEYRQAHGPFRATSDLMRVDGIWETVYVQIADYITVGGYHEDSGC